MNLVHALEQMEIWGVKVLNAQMFSELFFRFLGNIVICFVIARVIYYPLRRNREYLFTFFSLNTIIFFVCYLMNSVNLSIGISFGLFAVFSILRYRTLTVPIKEMTYLFIVISIAVINALGTRVTHTELLFTNLVVVGFTYMLEHLWLAKSEIGRTVIYEKIEFIKPENHALLMADLRERTGLSIHRVEIGQINFLQDTVRMKVYYFERHLPAYERMPG